MFIEKSNIKPKRNCCIFCLKLQTQLPRHLKTVHRDKDKVKNSLFCLKIVKKRKKIIDILRKESNFTYDTKKTVNTGQLIVSRQLNAIFTRTAKNYIALKVYSLTSESFTYSKWLSLTEVTLTLIHVFNRRYKYLRACVLIFRKQRYFKNFTIFRSSSRNCTRF
ncbi:hypothetical protein ALC56_06245 [Trachymyrmex septentrionalis]|uniref:Uncharacterized protein n=1 Tax=Trachymyrmex septentrionalis TaxID=34720 RepID=A0A151JX60_9HYME|nr:hypothetical protein ALC56_06245 [Trachymyrmex septentrionalis]